MRRLRGWFVTGSMWAHIVVFIVVLTIYAIVYLTLDGPAITYHDVKW